MAMAMVMALAMALALAMAMAMALALAMALAMVMAMALALAMAMAMALALAMATKLTVKLLRNRMKIDAKEIEVNGVKFVPANLAAPALDLDGREFVVVRGDRSGVQCGYLADESPSGRVELLGARRLYYWEGAATCTQLAVDGVSKPENCKFTKPIARIIIKDVIEILPCTDKARESLLGVDEWSA